MKIKLNTSILKDLIHQEQQSDSKTEDAVEGTIAPYNEPLKTIQEAPKNLSEIRTVIKIDEKNEEENIQDEESEEKHGSKVKPAAKPADSNNEMINKKKDLEDKREYLKSFKDFDIRINENREKIEQMVEKINSLTGDLDDLVSLYEIVSEQMNPFVGLSKVTKERIDALENFTSEIKELRERLERVEGPQDFSIENVTEHRKNNTVRKENHVEPETCVCMPQTIYEKNTEPLCSDEELDFILEESLRSLQPLKTIEQEIHEFLNSIS